MAHRSALLASAGHSLRHIGLIALLTASGCATDGEQSMLNPMGHEAEEIAELWWVMYGLAAAVWVAVVAALLWAVFRARGDFDDPRSKRRRFGVVAASTAATVIILVAVLLYSLLTGRETLREQPDALTIEVIGYRFWWEARYLDDAGEVMATTANEVHLPVDRPVHFRLRSADVIHSFWIPNLAGKVDMIPGRINHLWVRAREPGIFRGQCAEFCGIQHAKMGFMAVVKPEEEFRTWLSHQSTPAPAPTEPLAVLGQRVFLESACAECHAIRGTPADAEFGPELTHLASRLTLGAGILPNTRGHLGGWITNPQQIKPGNNMPAVPLTSEQLIALLHYLETLR